MTKLRVRCPADCSEVFQATSLFTFLSVSMLSKYVSVIFFVHSVAGCSRTGNRRNTFVLVLFVFFFSCVDCSLNGAFLTKGYTHVGSNSINARIKKRNVENGFVC